MEKVFFYCCPTETSENAAYQAAIVALAEGFKELGIPCYSNIDYWKIHANKDEYLCQYDPAVQPDDCTIVVIDGIWFTFGNTFPENLFHSERKYVTVYLEQSAGGKYGWEPEFRQFDFIFRSHYNCEFQYPSNFYPWAFGLTNRIIQETQKIPDFSEREDNLLVNFRIKHPLREFIIANFLPLINSTLKVDSSTDGFDAIPTDPYHHLQWEQTGMRHYPNYYARMKKAIACACFGGLFINPWPRDKFGPTNFGDRLLNRFLKNLNLGSKRLMNWESSRFWESLASGCVTFHVDLAKYGASLPIMPENWRHYVGVDLENMEMTIARLLEEPNLLETISVEGREWALKHYSPVPTAIRFLETIRERSNCKVEI